MAIKSKNVKIPLVDQHYQTKSIDQNTRKLINMFVVPAQSESKFPQVAYSTPGLTTFCTTFSANGEVRTSHLYHNTAYAIIDDRFCIIDAIGNATQLGTLNSASGFAQMASTNTQIAMIDSGAGYVYTVATGVFAEITDADFPDSPQSIAAMDGFFIVSTTNTHNFQISGLNDGTSWSALDTETAEADSDNIVALHSRQKELFIFGDVTMEIYINTGNTNFPFERQADGVLPIGCAARESIASAFKSLFWLASSKNGANQVYALSGNQLQVISTDAIASAISDLSAVIDAVGYVYEQDGFEFYVLTFPEGAKSFVYCITTGLWHEWSSFSAGLDIAHRGNCHIYAYSKNLIGDRLTGNIYELSTSTYTENGNIIKRALTTAPLYIDNHNITLYNLRFDIAPGQGLATGQGSDPSVMIFVSRDGGHTFGTQITRSAGAIGEYLARVELSRVGSARSFVFRLEMSDPIKWEILGATAMIEIEGV